MKKEQKQVSFAKGMIENIKQDLPNEVNPVFESALWLENYTPNIQRDSLIMRSDQSNKYHIIQDADILEVGEYSDLATYSYTNYMINDDSHELLREILVTSNMYMQVTQPFYNDNYLAFIRRFSNGTNGADYSPHSGVQTEATAVVAWVPYIGSGGIEQVGWREPFHDAEDYPGWYVLGTWQDAARYGETVIFVTRCLRDMAVTGLPGTYDIADTWHDKMYPCYVWQWWDLHNKRSGIRGSQKFWNGLPIGDLNDPKFRLWRVRRPSQAISKEGLVEAIALYQHPSTWKGMDGGDPAGKAIQLLIWESPLKTYAGFANQTAYDNKFADIQNNNNWELPLLYNNPFFKSKNLPFIESLELLDNDTLYTYGFDSVNRRIRQGQIHQGIFQNGEDVVTFPIKGSSGEINNPATWTGSQGFVFKPEYHRATFSNGDRIMRLLAMPTENRVITTESHRDNDAVIAGLSSPNIHPETNLCNPYGEEDDDLYSGNSKEHVSKDPNTVVVGTRMPNYLEAGVPRQWVQSEKIPFCLTAVVNGIEVVILKNIYTVATHNYMFTESMFNPFTWCPSTINPIMSAHVKIHGGDPVVFIYFDGSVHISETTISDAPIKASKRIGGNPYNSWTAEYYMKSEIRHQQYLESLPTNRNMRVLGGLVVLPYYAGVIHYQSGNCYSYPYDKPIAYMYEPFNPTGELVRGYLGHEYYRLNNPHPLLKRDTTHEAWSDSGRNSALNYLFNVATDNAFGFYLPELCEGNMVHFGLRIKNDFWDDLSSMNVTAFNLYVSKPDLQSSIIRSVGTMSPKDPEPGLYPKAKVSQDNVKDSQDFALVKTWLIEGEGSPVSNWKNYNGVPLSTNAWYDNGTYIYAVPQNADGSARGSVPTFVDHNTDYGAIGEADSWTPDFILWDYPVHGKNLSLNSSGDYWDGIGARLVAVIKGRTFLGGCIDRNGQEDVALVRYSDVQSGVAAQDVFSQERKMRIGHNAHTAFVVYREQLWFFTRYDNYRMQMPNVYDESTWEWLDSVGMGTFSAKTVCETPYGLVYCNEAGVWITDGRIPENMAVPILPSYQRLIRSDKAASGAPEYMPEPAYIGEYVDPTDPTATELLIRNSEENINPYLECTYDTIHDELVVSTPMWIRDLDNYGRWVPKREYRLIYSFANKNWRVESYDLPETRIA